MKPVQSETTHACVEKSANRLAVRIIGSLGETRYVVGVEVGCVISYNSPSRLNDIQIAPVPGVTRECTSMIARRNLSTKFEA